MVPKAIYPYIPQRKKHYNQHGFSKWNPNIIDDKKTTTKIIEI